METLEPTMECGDIGEVTFNNRRYVMNLNESGFGCYQVDLVNEARIIAHLDCGNGLISYDSSSSGKWVGLSTGCWYDKCTEYYLYDLSAATDDTNTEDDGFTCVGGNRHGWFVHNVSYNFEVDLEQEKVTWKDGTVLGFEQLRDSRGDHFKLNQE